MSLSFYTNFGQDYGAGRQEKQFEFQKFNIYGNPRKPRRDVNRYNTEVTVCANCFNIIKRHVANTGVLAFRMILKIDQTR
jgi:hypothetical protein